MLRLQLLPDQVFEGSRIRKAIILCTLIFLIDAVVCLLWFSSTKTALASMTEQADVANGFQTQIAALDAEIGALQALIAPVDSKHDYILGLKDYGDQWPAKMRELSKFIYARVEVLSAQLDPEGFELEVRTKTTEDVARLLMNLKAGYAAGLIQTDSLNVTGLTGWPNLTSPPAFSNPQQRLHIDMGGGEQGSRTSPGSNSNPFAQQQQAGGGGGEFSDSAEMPADEGMSSSEMSGEPGFEGGFGGSGGAPASQVDSDAMRALAIAKYIEPSNDREPQPYLNLTITGRWMQPLVEPVGNAPAGAAPAGVVPGGEFSGDPGMSEGAPPMEDSGSAGE
jgi:hypothetical protein